MGLFGTPKSVYREEFHRMLNHSSLHSLPHEDKQRVIDLADTYFDRKGDYRGIREEEKAEFMEKAKNMIRPAHHNDLDALDRLMDEGIKGNYGQ